MKKNSFRLLSLALTVILICSMATFALAEETPHITTKQVIDAEGNLVELPSFYTTSGNSNTGTITRADPYTQEYGLTLGVAWEESNINAEITSSGKDVYVTCDGAFVTSLLVDGFIELFREPVSMSKLVVLVR